MGYLGDEFWGAGAEFERLEGCNEEEGVAIFALSTARMEVGVLFV